MLQDIVSQYKGSFAPGASTELRAQRNLTRRVTLISGSLTSFVPTVVNRATNLPVASATSEYNALLRRATITFE